MSILKARLINGKSVYAMDGEKLRDEEIVCPYCNARMHIRKFPGSESEYYFAKNPGEEHTSVYCQAYENEKHAPVLRNESPEELIKMLSVSKTNKTSSNEKNESEDRLHNDRGPTNEPKRITNLTQIIKTGMWFENPFESTYIDSGYRYIDFVVFFKWAKYIWKNDLVPIGARIVHTRWIGCFESKNAVIKHMKDNRQIWFKTFWRVGDNYHSVRFCLDCGQNFNDARKKLFTTGTRPNGTFSQYELRQEKLDVLVAGYWAIMDKADCHELCPCQTCEECYGAYWAKFTSRKQVEEMNNRQKEED